MIYSIYLLTGKTKYCTKNHSNKSRKTVLFMSTQPARALEVIKYRNVNSNVADEIHFQLKQKAG